MNEPVVQDGDVLVRKLGALRHITLNRPKALNAITLEMAETMTAFMREWVDDPAVGTVLIDGAGGRAFAAGGDIRALYDAAKSGDLLPERFWATEYHLNVLIARYPKPVITIMDGLVMGGGVGLSAHAAHRIVTERSSVAMPEVGIGFFPDVGVSFPLSRAPGYIGTYLALTGNRIAAADTIYGGLADIHIPTARLTELPAALADCRDADEVRARVGALSSAPSPGLLRAAQSWIDRSYGTDTLEDIIDRLSGCDVNDARAALETMLRASPTSLKITLRNLRTAASFKRVEESFVQDYRIALACIAGHDFIEGIRAALVDKDRAPVWRPDRLEAVTPDIVDRHFKSVGALELKFEN
jgi:enoyl-CoA hydratase